MSPGKEFGRQSVYVVEGSWFMLWKAVGLCCGRQSIWKESILAFSYWRFWTDKISFSIPNFVINYSHNISVCILLSEHVTYLAFLPSSATPATLALLNNF
jgi:hypothetical protein